jgi:hypothetical protein
LKRGTSGDEGHSHRRRYRGLTAAAALGRAGVEVAVFERAPELKYEKIARYRT